MKQSRFTEQQIVTILEEGERGEQSVDELCRKPGIHRQTYYGWRQKYGGISDERLANKATGAGQCASEACVGERDESPFFGPS